MIKEILRKEKTDKCLEEHIFSLVYLLLWQ